MVCSHKGDDGIPCPATLPKGSHIPPGWSVARIEEYKENQVEFYYAYLCPLHIFTSTEKQTSLFDKVTA